MILTCLETVKLTSFATHPLPDQLHQQHKGEAGKLLPLPSGPRIIRVTLQGQHAVERLFLIQGNLGTNLLKWKLPLKPEHREGKQFSRKFFFKLLNITAFLSLQEQLLPQKLDESILYFLSK